MKPLLLMSFVLVSTACGAAAPPPSEELDQEVQGFQCGGVRRAEVIEPYVGSFDSKLPPELLEETLTIDGEPIKHVLPRRQLVFTPIPLYIEPPAFLVFRKAVVRYKPFGERNYRTVEMKKVGDGIGAEIPCKELTTTGDLKYFILLADENGIVVAALGSREQPFPVSMVKDLEGGLPFLPGHPPRRPCGPTH